MKINNVNRQVSYNVQTAVDVNYPLIFTHDVMNSMDGRKLLVVNKIAQKAVGKVEINVLAEIDYSRRGDIQPYNNSVK